MRARRRIYMYIGFDITKITCSFDVEESYKKKHDFFGAGGGGGNGMTNLSDFVMVIDALGSYTKELCGHCWRKSKTIEDRLFFHCDFLTNSQFFFRI